MNSTCDKQVESLLPVRSNLSGTDENCSPTDPAFSRLPNLFEIIVKLMFVWHHQEPSSIPTQKATTTASNPLVPKSGAQTRYTCLL